MTSTLTIRLSGTQREALKRRAAALKKTESSLVRDLVEQEISNFTPSVLVEKWAGAVNSGKPVRAMHPLKEQIHERNWRA